MPSKVRVGTLSNCLKWSHSQGPSSGEEGGRLMGSGHVQLPRVWPGPAVPPLERSQQCCEPQVTTCLFTGGAVEVPEAREVGEVTPTVVAAQRIS